MPCCPSSTIRRAVADDSMRNPQAEGSRAEALQSISRSLHQDIVNDGLRTLFLADSPAGTPMMVHGPCSLGFKEVGSSWPYNCITGASR